MGEPSKNRKVSSKADAMPVEVEILTLDHEIKGLIYVARDTDDSRRISELLNDTDRRFLAVTDAQLIPRKGPGSAMHYRFLQIQISNIILLHPSTESMARNISYSGSKAGKMDNIRNKLKKSH